MTRDWAFSGLFPWFGDLGRIGPFQHLRQFNYRARYRRYG